MHLMARQQKVSLEKWGLPVKVISKRLYVVYHVLQNFFPACAKEPIKRFKTN